jgi:hypothetical protein
MHIKLWAWVGLILGVVLANFPFLYRAEMRKLAPEKSWQRLSAWLLLYGVWMLAAAMLERSGSLAVPWRWQLWVVSLAFFAVLAFPGLVWRYLYSSA